MRTLFRSVLALAMILSSSNLLTAQLLPSFGDSRTGTSGMQFLKIAPDARSMGMAGAYTAIVDDLSAVYWNPAGLTGLDSSRLHAQLGYTEYFAGIGMQFGAAAYRLSPNTVIAGGLVYLNSGDMDVTTEFQPLGTGQTFQTADMGLSATLASQLTERFSFGVTARYVNERIASVSTHNAVFDFGFQYDIGLANTRFAVGFSNFGFNTSPAGEIEVTGVEGSQMVTDFEEISIPAVFRLGLAWDPIRNDWHRFTVAAQLNHPTDNNETYGLGLEYAWRSLMVVRAGYLFGQDQGSLPSAGFGIWLPKRYGRMRLDYGFSHHARLGSVHRLGLGVSIIDKAFKPRGDRGDTPAAPLNGENGDSGAER